jgi:hypothetical protein
MLGIQKSFSINVLFINCLFLTTCNTLSLNTIDALPQPMSHSTAQQVHGSWGLPPLHLLLRTNELEEKVATRTAFSLSNVWLPPAPVISTVVVPMIAGGVATAVGDLIVHPFDTIKTMMQL